MTSNFTARSFVFRNWKRWLVLWGGFFLGGLIIFLMMWHTFFVYVGPGEHLRIIANEGAQPGPNDYLVKEGEKGVLRTVLGEGWHFIMPIAYSSLTEKNTEVEAGKIGIVVAKGGKPLPRDQQLAEEGQQGIQRSILPPGAYRINLYGYDVKMIDATEIKPGYVGVLRRKLGKEGSGRFAADDSNEMGILRKILQPGFYYINTEEFEVVRAEIGIFQTGFRYDPDEKKSTAIRFTSRGGFDIKVDCTVEWEVKPQDMPSLIAEYGSRDKVEKNVIDVQAHAIGRDKGIDYSAQDFLEGSKREKFQSDFTKELERVCKEKNVTVHSAFIRNIVIPDEYLKPIRDRQIAAETELTNRAKQATAESESMVEYEQQLIQKKVVEVEAETKRLTTAIEQDRENLVESTKVAIERLKAEFGAKIAEIERERTLMTGEAEAKAKRLKETAKNSLLQMKMEVFQNDANAFLRYSMAKEQLNPKLILRLFHSGPGTFWTNMDGKGMNILLPAPGSEPAKASAVTPSKGAEMP